MLALIGSVHAVEAQRLPRRQRAATGNIQSILVDGRERTYVVRAPRARDAALPVVIVLHGGGGNADNAERMSGFTRLVEAEGLIAVYPDGSSRLGDRLLTWNAGHCCGYAMQNRVDDVRFIDALIDKLTLSHQVDTTRIYITGMSNGGMMTHRLAREMRHRPAAIAPVVGAVFGDETPARSPVAAIIFNGLRDNSVPADGGHSGGVGRRAWDGTPTRPNRDQGDFWSRSNGCTGEPTVSETPRVRKWVWPCPGARAVELYQLKEGAHAWPGGHPRRRGANTPPQDLDATRMMWEFFESKRVSG